MYGSYWLTRWLLMETLASMFQQALNLFKSEIHFQDIIWKLLIQLLKWYLDFLFLRNYTRFEKYKKTSQASQMSTAV